MDCDRVREELSAYLDGELAAPEAGQLRAHLDRCPTCRGELDSLRRAAEAVKDLPPLKAPAGLREKVMAGVRAEETADAPRMSPWRAWWPVAATVLIAAVIMLLNRAPEPKRAATRDYATLQGAESKQLADRDAGKTLSADELRSITPREHEPAIGADKRAESPAHAVAAEGGAKDSKEELALRREKADSAASPAAGAVATKPSAPPAAAPTVPAPMLDRSAAKSAKGEAAPLAKAVAPFNEEIPLLSEKPQEAFTRALALAKERGWAVEQTEGERKEKSGPEVARLVLSVKARDVAQVRQALTQANLLLSPERQNALTQNQAANQLSPNQSAQIQNQQIWNNQRQRLDRADLPPDAPARITLLFYRIEPAQ